MVNKYLLKLWAGSFFGIALVSFLLGMDITYSHTNNKPPVMTLFLGFMAAVIYLLSVFINIKPAVKQYEIRQILKENSDLKAEREQLKQDLWQQMANIDGVVAADREQGL